MTRTITVAAPGVGQDQKFAGVVVMALSMSQPPLFDGIDGKLGRIRRDAHMDESMISAHIVYPIGSCFAPRILREIVRIHLDRFLGPDSARVLEIADQLFVFRINADYGQAVPEEALLLLLNITELSVAVRMGWTREAFTIRLQAQASFFNSRTTDICETS
jgi:hypothetical protein